MDLGGSDLMRKAKASNHYSKSLRIGKFDLELGSQD